MKEKAKTVSDVLDSLEAIISNADHSLMDDGRLLKGDGGAILLKLRDGSTWEVMPRCLVGGKEFDNGVEPDGPVDGDLVTEDMISFFEAGHNWNPAFRRASRPTIRVPLGGPWYVAVKDYMNRIGHWPNVWVWGHDTGYQLLRIEMEDEE